jgi:two-component system, NtrC family, response regulator HydG
MNERERPRTILVVDDSLDTLEVLRRNLEAADYRVHCATGVPQAVQLLTKEAVDVVVTDLRMPGVSGIELVRHVRENLKETEVLMITGYPSVEGAVAAMRTGAADYLPKPFTAAELLAAIERAIDRIRARRSMQRPPTETPQEQIPGLLGASPAMQSVFRSIREHAEGLLPVLIRGENGTGMRSVARALHSLGPHSAAPLVEVDCAVLAGSLRALTEGTLYLADVDSLARADQERLLAILSGDPTGRVVASTSIDLAGMVERGMFDERLHRRLSAVQISLPPLRERGDDLLSLARHFAERAAKQLGLPCPAFDDRALAALQGYPWPGNVVELWWTIRRLVADAKGEPVELPDLPAPMRSSAQGPAAALRSLADVEGAHIQEVLAAVNGNRTRAAEILGIDRKTLREKIKRAALA